MALNQKDIKVGLDMKEEKEAAEQSASAIKFSNLAYIQEKGVNKELGKGGCGKVYLGTYRQVEGHVAIKELFIKSATDEMVKEFENEAQVMEKLRSDYLVQFYGYCLSPKYCLVMEFMPEGSLYSLLHSNKPLDWGMRYQISMHVSLGLEFLHEKNILHRDIKSLNVLLKNGRAKLSDFGLSRIKKESNSTQGGSVGTVQWMAPELFERRAKYIQKSDIYSLGMTFWEIASRQVPFSDAENGGMIAAWVGQGIREGIPEDCPKKFASLIFSCWKGQGPKVDKRWQGQASDRPSARQITDYLRSNEDDFEAFISPKLASNNNDYIDNLASLPLKSTSNANPQNNSPKPLTVQIPKPIELTPEQHFQLGQDYYNGKGVVKNDQTAVQHFQTAANQKHANAQGWLGHCFETGAGIPKDLKKANEYYQLAEKQGISWVQEKLKQLPFLEASGIKEVRAAVPLIPARPSITRQFQGSQAPVEVKSKVEAKESQIFLNHIARGRQDEAEVMLKINKELALAADDVTDHAKRTFKNITGLQYAVWALDWKMWTMLLAYLPQEAAIAQAKGFTQGSWLKEHSMYANWKNLTDALQVYIKRYNSWNKHQCKKYWIEQVGGTQFELPIHVLQEYCNPNRSFKTCPNFSAQYSLQRSLPNWLEDAIKGAKFNFGILRTKSLKLDGNEECRGMLADRYALISLYDTRMQQRNELVIQLLGKDLSQNALSPQPSRKCVIQ